MVGHPLGPELNSLIHGEFVFIGSNHCQADSAHSFHPHPNILAHGRDAHSGRYSGQQPTCLHPPKKPLCGLFIIYHLAIDGTDGLDWGLTRFLLLLLAEPEERHFPTARCTRSEQPGHKVNKLVVTAFLFRFTAVTRD